MAQTRVKVTLSLPAEVVRAYRINAARQGKRDNSVIEEALRAHLGLGLLEELTSISGLQDKSDQEISKIAVNAVRKVRKTSNR
jgi:hypothetical protein